MRFSYLALVQGKKNHVRFTGKCMLYSLCHNNLHAIHKNTELLFWLTWRGNNSHCLHDRLLKVHCCQQTNTKLKTADKSDKLKSNTGKKCNDREISDTLALGCRRFPCLALLPVLDSIYLPLIIRNTLSVWRSGLLVYNIIFIEENMFICQLKTPMIGSIITWKSQYLH